MSNLSLSCNTNQSKIIIGGDNVGNGQLTANKKFTNTGEIDVEKKGILQVDGLLTNSNRLSVKAWTIPEPANKECSSIQNTI